MKTYHASAALVLLTIVVASGTATGAMEAPDDPPFETVLLAQPLVVVAKYLGSVDKESVVVPAVVGDIDPRPAYRETFLLERYAVVERLKGDMPDEFDVRSRPRRGADPEPGEAVLMVLAPDVGPKSKGELHDAYIVAHGARYRLYGDVVLTDEGKKLTVDEVAEIIRMHEEAQHRRLVESPEPPGASLQPVVAGEREPIEEESSGSAPRLRPQPARNVNELGDVRPEKARGPAR